MTHRAGILTAAMLLLLSGITSSAQGILDLHPRDRVEPRLLSARKTSGREAAPWTLLWFSDIHGDCVNLSRIVVFRDAYSQYIDAAIHTGDSVNNFWDDPNPWASVPGADSIMNAVGNHDCWKGRKLWAQSDRPYDASPNESYTLLLEPYVLSWGVTQPEGVTDGRSPHFCACYYYKDYPSSHLRMVVLDCIHYDDVQHEWFESVLSDALASGLLVLCVQHYPAQNGLDLINCGFSELRRTAGREDDPPAGKQMERMPDKAFAAVDRFIGRGGRFACWIGGHMHTDFIGHVNGHPRQLQILTDKAGAGDRYVAEDRTYGTANQDAFNLMTINPDRGFIALDRIGCTRDRYMRSKSLFVYDFIHNETITTE